MILEALPHGSNSAKEGRGTIELTKKDKTEFASCTRMWFVEYERMVGGVFYCGFLMLSHTGLIIELFTEKRGCNQASTKLHLLNLSTTQFTNSTLAFKKARIYPELCTEIQQVHRELEGKFRLVVSLF